MSAGKKPFYSGAQLREMRAAREQFENSPIGQARLHEESFLKNLSNAQDDFEWILANDAWTVLGHETFAGWWETRVQPLMRALSMRPSPALAGQVIDKVMEEEAELPSAQQRTQSQVAELAGVSRKTVQRRLQDQPQGTMSPGSDLEDATVDPLSLVPEAERAIEEHLNRPPADDSEADGADPASGGPQATGADVAGPSAPVANPETTEDAIPGVAVQDSPTGEPVELDAVTDVEAASAEAPSLPVDEREQQAPAGVSASAAPASDQDPVGAIAVLAEVFEAVDVDVVGPLLTSAQLVEIGESLDRIVNVIELLTRWHERGAA